MGDPNPFVSGDIGLQHVSWKHLSDGFEYEFTLIKPFNGVCMDYRGTDAYLCFCAVVRSEFRMDSFVVGAGEFILLDIPIRTFNRAWDGVPRPVRLALQGEDGVRLRFAKNSFQDIRVLSCARDDVKPDVLELAVVEYGRVLARNKLEDEKRADWRKKKVMQKRGLLAKSVPVPVSFEVLRGMGVK